MVQTGMSTPFGATAPATFTTQNGDVKPDVKDIPLLPPPATGPPFSPPPQPVAATEQQQQQPQQQVSSPSRPPYTCGDQQQVSESETATPSVTTVSTTEATDTTVAITVTDPTKNQPKRLHVSNIPFRFRDPDLRAMFGVSSSSK